MSEQRAAITRLITAARLIRTHFDRRARDAGITLAQWRTLVAIRDEPGISQRMVANELEVTEVTAGRLIDKLCEQNWVERRPDPKDRRANRLYLTGRGEPFLDELNPLAVREEEHTLAVLTVDEMVMLRNLLERVSTHLEKSA